jgi:hypothetical protein
MSGGRDNGVFIFDKMFCLLLIHHYRFLLMEGEAQGMAQSAWCRGQSAWRMVQRAWRMVQRAWRMVQRAWR